MNIRGDCMATLQEGNQENQNRWHYVIKGNQYGPVSKDHIISLYEKGTITITTKVWRPGFENWMELAKTEIINDGSQPPLLQGSDVKNTLIWVLAFTPIIGMILEIIISDITHIDVSNLWFITVIINIIICTSDAAYLKKLGYTEKGLFFWGLTFIPIYLLKRAKLLKQKYYYLVVWIISFAILIFLPGLIANTQGNVDNRIIYTVKNGALFDYPDKTIGEMVEGFVGDPKWEAIVDDDGITYVNIGGSIFYNDSKVRMLLQYKINDDDTFELQALEFNGEPQNILTYNALIRLMYEEALGLVNQIGDQDSSRLDDIFEEPTPTKEWIPTHPSHDALLLQDAGHDYIILDGLSITTGDLRVMNIDTNGDGEEETFLIQRDSPNGLKVMGVLGEYGQNFVYDTEIYDAFDDYGEISEDYYVQITCYDLDGDGLKEVIVSIGDKFMEMETLIYSPISNDIQTPFQLIGQFYGQEMMYIYDDIIIVPYGSQGLFRAYEYMYGELYEVEM